MSLTLYIGNKAYSSWSLRPWLLMRHLEIAFEEVVIPLNLPTTSADIQRHSPTGRVPALTADGIIVWESLAILEYLAERYPEKRIWPADPAIRAQARALASEMHAGFQTLRQVCPTNFRRSPRAIDIPDEARRDVDRIEAAWAAARAASGAKGPFLFNEFSAADAMFAPVVNRLDTYCIDVRPETRAYMDTIMDLSAWKAWVAEAHREPWSNKRFDAM